MITVSFFRDGNGKVTRITASGHSGYAERGNDIVCAAVSTLVQTAYLAIADITDKITFDKDEAKAYFGFTVGDVDDRHDIDIIIRAVTVGLKDLACGYPQHIKLEE